jgi:hypothetical protein
VSANPEHDEDVARADDLTQIAGIGTKRAERLNAAGIWTYAELAACSADDLAKLVPEPTGLSAAQLDGWRDRARELAAQAEAAPAAAPPAAAPPAAAGPAAAGPAAAGPAAAGPAAAGPAVSVPAQAGPVAKAGNGQHEESFLVRVLLNEDGSVRRTTVRHVGTGAQRQWPGMERDALPGFIEAAARSAPWPSSEPAERASGSGEAQPAEPVPAAAPPDEEPPAAAGGGLAAAARLMAEQTVLRAAEPFTMTMAIDLAEAAGGAERLAYAAIVEAKPLAGGPKLTVAQSDGLLATATPTIHIDAAGLPAGTYRLDGAVSLRESGESHRAGLAAMAEGLLVHVLPS